MQRCLYGSYVRQVVCQLWLLVLGLQQQLPLEPMHFCLVETLPGVVDQCQRLSEQAQALVRRARLPVPFCQ